MGSGFESGKENFQMRAEINCDERIHAYVKNNREKISRWDSDEKEFHVYSRLNQFQVYVRARVSGRHHRQVCQGGECSGPRVQVVKIFQLIIKNI